MGRPARHTADAMLDTARELLLERGVGAATIAAIAAATGAPSGSIYHRFGSRDELFARLWLRGIRRFQRTFLAALEVDDAHQAALAAAVSIVDFCAAHRADARLIVSMRRADLMHTGVSARTSAELEKLNEPIEHGVTALARRLYGGESRAAVRRVVLAVVDLPYGAVRRHLVDGSDLPSGLRGDLRRAASAVLDGPQRYPDDAGPLYLVGELAVRDLEKLVEYGRAVPELMADYGGRILAVGRRADTTVVEGSWDADVLVIHRWPSLAAFNEFYRSAAYQPLLALRHSACEANLAVFTGFPDPRPVSAEQHG